MPRHVEIGAPQRSSMAALVTEHRVPVVIQSLREVAGRWLVHAFVEDDVIDRLRAAGYRVDPVGDEPREIGGGAGAHAVPDRAAEEVRRDRAGPGSGPEGYLSVEDVDARLASLAKDHPRVTELIEAPHRSWEGRPGRILRIGADPDAPGIALLGGVHAREWGSCDILVAFADRLVRAHAAGRGVTIGQLRVSANAVKRLVERTTIYVFAQVNPDGRHYSMTVDPNWRKNRRPRVGGRGVVGVDVNRNFDFLWHYPTYFAPAAPVVSDVDPRSELFSSAPPRGPSRRPRTWCGCWTSTPPSVSCSMSTATEKSSSTTGGTTRTRPPTGR